MKCSLCALADRKSAKAGASTLQIVMLSGSHLPDGIGIYADLCGKCRVVAAMAKLQAKKGTG